MQAPCQNAEEGKTVTFGEKAEKRQEKSLLAQAVCFMQTPRSVSERNRCSLNGTALEHQPRLSMPYFFIFRQRVFLPISSAWAALVWFPSAACRARRIISFSAFCMVRPAVSPGMGDAPPAA